MPLYRPEQFNEPGAGPGCLKRIFLFATDRAPDIFIDVGGVYETKLAACRAHLSQFPQGEANLEWMKELDQRRGQVLGVTYAEVFKQMEVW